MAWNTLTTYGSTDVVNAARFNGIGNDLRVWGDNVDANGKTLSNLLSLTGSSGKLGIGTTTPGYTLDVKDNIRIDVTVANAAGTLRFRNSPTEPTWTSSKIVGAAATGISYGGNLLFYTHQSDLVGGEGTERMRILYDGKVGMGTATPGFSASEQLTVVQTASAAKTYALVLANAASAASTEVALGFTPNTNIPLAEISALRTTSGGATSLKFQAYNGSSLVERMRLSERGAKLVGIPVYANNAAAIAGGYLGGPGLVADELYRTGANPDQICVVH